MPHKPEHPGDAAARAWLRKVMSDGRWRTSGDIVTRAKRDGMVMTPQAAGYHASTLVQDGYLIGDGVVADRMMWKARKSAREMVL